MEVALKALISKLCKILGDYDILHTHRLLEILTNILYFFCVGLFHNGFSPFIPKLHHKFKFESLNVFSTSTYLWGILILTIDL